MATVEYDTIMLNIGSKMNGAGFTKAINNLERMKQVFPIDGIQESANAMQAFADAINSINTDTIKAIASMKSSVRTSVKALRNGVGITQTTTGMPTQGTMVAPDVASTARSVAEEMGRVASASQETSTSTKEITKNIKNAGKHSRGLLGGLFNVAKYRALRAIITGIVQGFKQGVTNLENWDRNIGNTGFAEAIDKGRESLEVLKNSLAVMSAPLLEYLIDKLAIVAQWVMKVANGISEVIAVLGGKSSYRAVKWADYIAGTTDEFGRATKKAKEFQRQLMKFDEINNITDKTNDGGGSGSGKGGFKFKDMFEELPVDELAPWQQFIKNMVEKWREGWEEMTRRFAHSKEVIQQKWADFKEKWTMFVEDMGLIWERFVGLLKWLWNGATGWIKKGVNKIKQRIEEFKETHADTIERIKEAWENFKTTCSNVWQFISGYVKTVWGGICDYIKQLWNGVKTTFLTVIGVIKHGFNTIVTVVKSAMTIVKSLIEYVGTAFQNIKDLLSGKISLKDFKENMKEAGETLKKNVGGAVNDVRESLKKTFNTDWYIDIYGKIHVKEIDTSGLGSAHLVFEKYASGGFPSQGQLFIANEAGAEMVGTIGGSTAVATNQDIVSAVSQGVASAVASVLGGGTNVNVVLEGDARNLFRVVQSQARNYAIQTGSYAFG